MKTRMLIPLAALTAACAGTPEHDQTSCQSEPQSLRGVNLAGADFGEDELPGVYDQSYTYPTPDEVDYFVGKGMNVFRVPFRWERLQPELGGDFDPDEQARLQAIVEYATAQGASVLVDPHNYARYAGALIGEGPSVQEFAGFWARLAQLFSENPRVLFGLMNEPHDVAAEDWLAAANAAVAAIRDAGATNLILVPGTNWTGAESWSDDWGFGRNAEVMQGLVDPADHFLFEVHQYLDADSSGSGSECVSEAIGEQRLTEFTGWLRSHSYRGFLGEFGAPATPTCLAALDNTLSHVDANADVWAGWTYWAAGPWWDDYSFSVEPAGGVDKPQMSVLSAHLP
jgi:endoglucanase